MNLSLFIAKRYLISKKSNNAINIVSGISVAGIAVGTMALIIVLSAFNGLSDLVQSLYNSFDPDFEITPSSGKTFDPTISEIQALKNRKGIIHYSEVVEENALIKYKDKQCIATIKGVDENFRSLTGFDTLVKAGRFTLKEDSAYFAIPGKGICNLLDIYVDDIFSPLSIYVPKRGVLSTANPADAFNQKNLHVSGIFSINDDFDFKYIIVPISFARQLLEYKNEVSAIELGSDPNVNQDELQEEIKKAIGNKYIVKNRYQQNELLFKTLKSEKLWTFIILVFILIIATFNVIGSLTMLIIEKKKDIKILWNMGAEINLIRTIFLFEGILITLTGAVIGMLLGLGVCAAQIKYNIVKLSEGYIAEAYPVTIQAMDFVYVFTVVMIIGLIAAWYPVKGFTKKHLVKTEAA